MAWGFLGKSERETAAYMRYVRISSELLTPKASARYRLCKRSILRLSSPIANAEAGISFDKFDWKQGLGYKAPFHIAMGNV
ncbi:MAG: hypothetical protein JNK42_05910 [Caedimonas sp.]|nr:hypothetical protein [Caedimonas sp.]